MSFLQHIKTMIYHENPRQQFDECLDVLNAVQVALGSELIGEDSLACLVTSTSSSLKDAITRIEQAHTNDLKTIYATRCRI